MKVKDFLQTLNLLKEQCKDIDDWDIYVEYLDEPISSKVSQGFNIIKDSEDWQYIETAGFSTQFIKDKILTININF